MKSDHSSKPLLEVMMMDVFSDIDDTKPKKRLASTVESGINPTSSMRTSAAELSILSRRLLAVEICEVLSIIMSSSNGWPNLSLNLFNLTY